MMSSRLLAVKEFFFNPILEKDLRSTARSPRFFLFILVFLFIAGIVLLFLTDDLRRIRSGTGLELFTGMFVMQALCVALAIPAYACTTVAAERQHRTFDLLRITSLEPWHIVWGKFVAIMVYIGVFIISFAPLVSICFLYGGVDPLVMTLAYVYLLLSTATCAAFCLMLSAASSNTIKSVIVGYVFMFVVAIAWVAAGAELLDDATRRGRMSQKDFITAIGLIYLSMAFLWSLFYLASTSLLKPPSWNRSTSLRIWFAAYVIVSLAAFVGTSWWLWGRMDDDEVAVYLIALLGIPTLFAAIGFCGEPHRLPPRLNAKVAKIPAIFRPFFAPGSWTAAILVRMSFLLAGGIAMCAFASLGRRKSDLDEVFLLFLAIFVYINFCCSLASTVRRLWDTSRSRMITIAMLFALAILPLLAFLDANSYRTAPSIVWISPPMAMAGFADASLGGEAGPAVFFSFYIIGALVALFTGLVNRYRSGARAIVPAVEGRDEAGAPA
jgi:ABC-type transport system involved in multi-copper enzyme maturation permease subunit